MPASPVPPSVVAELQRQFNHELAAAHGYQALSVWCPAHNLTGFAAFFEKQSGEERTHAKKIIDHLIDRSVDPVLGAVPQPKQDFRSLLDVAQYAEVMEQANTKGINAVFEAALAAKDYPAQVLMHWFINEQVEEEAWCAELIDRVRSASCAGSLSDLDRHVVRIFSDEKD